MTGFKTEGCRLPEILDQANRLYLKLGARLLIFADGRGFSEIVIHVIDDIELGWGRFLEFGTKRTAPNLNKSVGRSIGRRLFDDRTIWHCL
jgi:hypothetical protein